MRTFDDIVTEFEGFKSRHPDNPLDLTEYAKQADLRDGVQDRAEAYRPRTLWNKANAVVDKAFDWSPAPEYITSPKETGKNVGGFIGSGFDRLLGTHITPTLEQVGAETPRMVAEGILTTLQPEIGAPALVSRLATAGKILGYSDAFTRGAAQNGIPGGVVSAGSLGLMNKLIPAAGQAAERGVTSYLERGVKDANVTPEARAIAQAVGTPILEEAQPLVKAGIPQLANVGAGAATATGLNELTRQADLTVTPDEFRQPGDRNPLTQENIAGNVAGTAFFLPQLLHSLQHGGPSVSPKQTRQLVEQLKVEKAAAQTKAQESGAASGDQGELPLGPGIEPSRQENLVQLFENSIAARQKAVEDGNDVDIARMDQTIEDTYNRIMSNPNDPLSPESVERTKEGIRTLARFMPGETPEKLSALAEAVKSHLDFLNEGRVSYEQELARRESELNYNDKKKVAEFQTWKAEQERRGSASAGKEQTWHPQARHSTVLENLWKSGDAPALSEPWLQKEFNETFDSSGNPQFSVDVVKAKITNYFADRLDALVAGQKARTKVEIAPEEYTGRKVDAREAEFINSLKSLPPTVLRDVLNRTVKIRSSERIDNRTGQTVSGMKEWQRAVVRAAQSYDPESGTILIPKTGKPGEGPEFVRVPITRLVEKSENGGYTWTPSERRVSVSEGGKSASKNAKGQQVAEGNIEALKTPEGDQMDIADEEAFKRALAEQSDMPFGERTDLALDKENVLNDPALDMVDESGQRAEQAIGDKMAEKQSQLRANLAKLSDEQLWKLAAPLFRTRNVEQSAQKKAQLRTALIAALETMKGSKGSLGEAAQKFLDAQKARPDFASKGKGDVEDVKKFLRNFFQIKIPVEGSSSKLPPNVDRIAQIVGKLTNEETMKRVLSGELKMQTQEESRPLVQFSGPIRLQKWLRGEYKLGVNPDALGRVQAKSVMPLLDRLGLTKSEMELYKAAGLEKFLGDRSVPVKELTEWMDKVTPKVEVKKLMPNDPNEQEAGRQRVIQLERNFNAAQHIVESAGYTPITDENAGYRFMGLRTKNSDLIEQGGIVYEYPTGDKSGVTFSELPLEKYPTAVQKYFAAKLEYENFARNHEPDQLTDAATGRYGVEPKELKDMPGAVDILVRVPQKLTNPELLDSGDNSKYAYEKPLYTGPHFGESDKNVLASVRGYVETLPSGEKVFHVFEVQSDWGQNRNKVRGDPTRTALNQNIPDHPLLAVYEQLALKAAIDHARSLGIKKVAISDAETAMMTERHDSNASPLDRFSSPDTQYGDTSGKYVIVDRQTGEIHKFDTEEDANVWIYKQRPTISQEPGMRAAYDQRLPQTMEKLTKSKGQLVDFGLHKSGPSSVFKGDGVFRKSNVSDAMVSSKGKNSVTARLYDISQAQPEFAAYGYGKPQVSADGSPTIDYSAVSGDSGVLVNRPQPGEFTHDAIRTLRTSIDTLLGRAGYSGTTREFFTEVATSLVMHGNARGADFYRTAGKVLGITTWDKEGRPALGMDVDTVPPKGDEGKRAIQLIQTLAHELGHFDGFLLDGLIEKPDAFSEERLRIQRIFHKYGETLTQDEREAMLRVVQEYVPQEMRTRVTQDDGKPYGTGSVDEFSQEMLGHAMNMLVFETGKGRAAAREMMDYMPQEVKEMYRNTFKTVADIMQTMRQAVEAPEVRLAETGEPNVLTRYTDPFITSRGFEMMLDTAKYFSELRYADKALADAQIALANGIAPKLGLTNSVWFTKSNMPAQIKMQASMPNEPSPSAVEAVGHANDFLQGPRAADKASRPGLVGRFLAPFRQEMWALERDGNPVARPIADSVFQLEAGAHRILSNLLSPFMKKGRDGSVQFDKKNPLIERISREKTGPFRDTINKISAWQQEVHEMAEATAKGEKVFLDAQPMFVQDKSGNVVVNEQVKGAREAWDKMRTQLSKEDQAFVMNQSVILDQIGQGARDVLLTSIKQTNTNRVASLLQAMNKQMSAKDAIALSGQVHDAFLTGNVLSLAGTLPPKQIEILQRLMLGPDGKSGLLNHLAEVSDHFSNRPGYRSESLPHDWIVRYRTPDDKVKFDSRPTELQAQTLARRLQSEGNRIDGEIINRRDANKFSPTDDPDGILTKVTERENYVWNKFVEEMTTKHGAQFGEELKSGYTPMETTMRDVSARGIGKFLKERKDFVARDSFDYIDSTLAYAERLAYTVAVRSMKQEVELYLNDPSVRLRPSLQNLVRGHVTEMLRPQSQVMKELKGIATGLMIGGNLGSVAANAMQSLSTLIPVLDLMNGKGSFVKPWGQMMKAIADATDYTLGHSWKDLAAQTKDVDPTKWTEDQTVAELWRRHVEAGGFTHTVVDDLLFGQDQQMLTNAKFGRGDYGPVSKASLVRSGLYLGNQLAMKPFRWVEHGNAKVAFLAGARLAFEQGLRGDAAYAKAAQLQGLATFGGGRANASGLQTALSKGFTPGGAGLALALQQYGFGIVAMHGQFVKDALGRSKDLSASEVWHARRAYGTYLMTQTALAGALGFPLVGAALTALEKVFGIPANQAVRQGLASLGEDDESGATIAEIALNGFGDYWTGLDVSSRLGTSSLLGTSSYRGFNLSDLAGPIGSILENGVKSLGYFGSGEPMRGATALAPVALKKALEMSDSQAKYGDNGIRDASGNLLYMPTDNQATAYAFGFRPREISRRRQLQNALQTRDEITTADREREMNKAVQALLKGDSSVAQRMGYDAMSADPVNGMQTQLRAIMDRAVASQTPKDPMATGSRWTEKERSAIYRTFGPDVAPRRSEVDLQNLRLQMAQLLGDPRIAPTADSYAQAAIVDSLVKGGSMPRSEAIRIVEMLGLAD